MKAIDIVSIALFAVIIAVCSWVTIPVLTIPITLQTFGITLTLYTLGGKKGTLAVLCYVLLGAVGVPVFSSFRAGFGVLLGITGGYIWGFVPMALLYWAAEKYLKNKYLRIIPGYLICYLLGTLQFAFLNSGKVGFGAALMTCVVPYILPDAVKTFLAGKSLLLIKKIRKF